LVGTAPGPRWGSLQRSPDLLAGLRGPYFQGKGGEGKGSERRGEVERGGERGRPPLTRIPGPVLGNV